VETIQHARHDVSNNGGVGLAAYLEKREAPPIWWAAPAKEISTPGRQEGVFGWGGSRWVQRRAAARRWRERKLRL